MAKGRNTNSSGASFFLHSSIVIIFNLNVTADNSAVFIAEFYNRYTTAGRRKLIS